MDDDLEALAKRANDMMHGHVDGFVECRVHSHEPPVLEFQFTGPVEAHQFLRQTDRTSPFKYAMAAKRVDTVLEYR